MSTIEFVSATRLSAADFANGALGLSLARLERDGRLVARIHAENTTGLSTLYNRAIADTQAEVLVFVHDDVWIEDMFVLDRVLEGLNSFDIIGIAGNRRPKPGALTWYTDEPRFLTGAVAHGERPLGRIRPFGPAPRPCELLDGLFIAVDVAKLRASGARFDEQFTFDFYDLDFCRTARRAGLSIGTWPISVTHQSGGDGVHGERWQRLAAAYLAKWPD